jgi:DNA excision repair protein ERCC-2
MLFKPKEKRKLIYCTRTVPEMQKVLEELKNLIKYIEKKTQKKCDLLGIGMSSRKNLCINKDVISSNDTKGIVIDSLCRNLTTYWVREKAKEFKNPEEAGIKLCKYYEQVEIEGIDTSLTGVYTLEEIKKYSENKGLCPYFTSRNYMEIANIIVFSFNYLLDPKIASIISKDFDKNSIIVFDEAHNIDGVCIESLSININKNTLDKTEDNLETLKEKIDEFREKNSNKLKEEYNKLVNGLGLVMHNNKSRFKKKKSKIDESNNDNEDVEIIDIENINVNNNVENINNNDENINDNIIEENNENNNENNKENNEVNNEELRIEMEQAKNIIISNPLIPEDIINESLPGNIRKAEHFVSFLLRFTQFLKKYIDITILKEDSPEIFLEKLLQNTYIEAKALQFSAERLNSLLNTLEIQNIHLFIHLKIVCDFATLVSTYKEGFILILEPYDNRDAFTRQNHDPILQLSCMDSTISIKPIFRKFSTVIITSGTLSPLDMYPKLLNFNPIISKSFKMSLPRKCILPLVIQKGSDQNKITTSYKTRDDQSVIRNYGNLLIEITSIVPDGNKHI